MTLTESRLSRSMAASGYSSDEIEDVTDKLAERRLQEQRDEESVAKLEQRSTKRSTVTSTVQAVMEHREADGVILVTPDGVLGLEPTPRVENQAMELAMAIRWGHAHGLLPIKSLENEPSI